MQSILLVAALAAWCSAQEPGALAVPAVVDPATLNARLRKIAEAHPDWAQVELVGRSRGEREILALRLHRGGPDAVRPAILVAANVEGPESFSSALALWQASEVARRAADAGDDAVRNLLDTTTLYFVPCANPDGLAARFETPLAERRATGSGADNDRDGVQGEDPAQDVDGDGVLLDMRVPDPEGSWMDDPADARAAIAAARDKGQRGRFRIDPEGRDLDRDERAAEDGARDAEVARNFASGWEEHAAPSGRFPMDEPEARALADFVLAHKDLAAVVCYGALDNVVKAPASVKDDAPRVKLVPPSGWLESDAALLAELGRRHARDNAAAAASRAAFAGSFPAWTYDHRGLMTVAVVPWDIPLDAAAKHADAPGDTPAETPGEAPAKDQAAPKDGKKDEPSDDAKRLAWCDAQGEGARFRAWTDFEHPELGRVQIGGWRPYSRIEPPAPAALHVARGELAFLIALADALPRPTLTEVSAKELGAGLLDVRAVLTNEALLPWRSAAGQRADTARALRVRLSLSDGAVRVAGPAEELVGDLAGTGGRRELRWLVRAPATARLWLEIDSDRAGAQRVDLEVVR